MQPRYLLGVALFCFTYVVLGANNYMLPYFLQTGLGYSWDTIGTFQAFGLGGALGTWLVMAMLIPKFPAPKNSSLQVSARCRDLAGLCHPLQRTPTCGRTFCRRCS